MKGHAHLGTQISYYVSAMWRYKRGLEESQYTKLLTKKKGEQMNLLSPI